MKTKALWLSLLLACDGVTVVTTDSGDSDEPADTEVEEPTCDVLDCTNPACAEEFECTWPTTLQHRSVVGFDGRTIDCLALIVTIPVEIPDCGSEVRANLTERVEGELCAECDRTFEGTLEYVSDTCSELLGQDPPTTGTWGFRFIAPDQRELWLPDVNNVWAKSADLMLQDNGLWTTSSVQPVELDPPDCNNGVQYLGDITVEGSFRDTP